LSFENTAFKVAEELTTLKKKRIIDSVSQTPAYKNKAVF